jgi:SET domain-containing protein
MASEYYLACFAGPPFDIRPSTIHGEGVFATRPIKTGEEFGPILVLDPNNRTETSYIRNQFGKKFNHSNRPNAAFKHHPDGWWVYALQDIAASEEITLDYAAYKRQIIAEYKSGDGKNVCVV